MEMKLFHEERRQSVEVRLSVDEQHKAKTISPLFHLNEKSGRGAMPQLYIMIAMAWDHAFS